VDSNVDAKDWHNQLTVTSNMITLALKDGKKLEIPPRRHFIELRPRGAPARRYDDSAGYTHFPSRLVQFSRSGSK